MYDNLTTRHKRILRRLANGQSTATIRKEMNFAERTNKADISTMFVVFGVKNRTELVAKALRAGVIE
jgi:DNA-binding NarL/FixJ family response regulator